jgi:hypothetical protein
MYQDSELGTVIDILYYSKKYSPKVWESIIWKFFVCVFLFILWDFVVTEEILGDLREEC